MIHPILFRSFKSDDMPEILRIQADNLVSNLPETERSDGFLSVAFSSRQFEEMNRDIPMVVADLGTRLAGYLCSSTLEYSRSIPLLSHMTGLFPEASFRGRTLDHYRSFFYGPVCVDRPHRGEGVIEGLFSALKSRIQGTFDVGVLFVSRSNLRSMQVHARKLGMTLVRDFRFDDRDFSLLAFEVFPIMGIPDDRN